MLLPSETVMFSARMRALGMGKDLLLAPSRTLSIVSFTTQACDIPVLQGRLGCLQDACTRKRGMAASNVRLGE